MARSKPSTRRSATLADLKTKPRRTKEVAIPLGDEVITVTVGSIPTRIYDDLVGENPPSKKDKDEGAQWNVDTFGPALIAKCTIEPAMSAEDALELWNSEDWARGELFDWFMACVDICNAGFRVPTTASDSATTPPSS